MRVPFRNQTFLLVVFLAISCKKVQSPHAEIPASASKTTKTPKEDCEALMNAVMPFAQQMLTKHREFFPFGATMTTAGQISAVAGTTGQERPESAAVIDAIEQGFREGAASGTLKATALAVDVRIVPPGKSTKQDAVEIRLDHREDYSARVVFPYSFSASGELRLEQPFAVPGEKRVFPGENPLSSPALQSDDHLGRLAPSAGRR